MKQYWQRLELKIDSLTLRERAMAFGIAALVLITLINTVVLDPLLQKQKQLSEQVKRDQQQIAALQADIQARVKSHQNDPDAVARTRLQSLKKQSAKVQNELAGMQKGLVSPDKMSVLLEDLLRQNGRLQLTSLKTLPVTLLNESPSSSPKDGGQAPAAKNSSNGRPSIEVVYKHGVELVVHGEYLDLMNYLSQLEAMPWQLFWAKARLNVDTYPQASLTLTLFTLSLDKKWLNI